MQIVGSGLKINQVASDLLVVGVFVDEILNAAALKGLDPKLKDALAQSIREQDFQGKSKQHLVLPSWDHHAVKRLALVGLGERAKASAPAFLRLGGSAIRLGNSVGAKTVHILYPDKTFDVLNVTGWVARGAWQGAYRFTVYKSEKGRASSVQEVFIAGTSPTGKEAIHRAQVIAEAVCMTRDWVNRPSNDLYPEVFAQQAVHLAKEYGLVCKVLSPDVLLKKNMNLLLAVGRGSAHGPRLVHVSYVPSKKTSKPPVCLIGKGITFDSGGLSLKSPDAMYGMKMDMAGAATVLATVIAAAKLKLSKPVHAIMALAENMPSGTACRPGDVVIGAAGISVEINNTDAEGRLVLADALHYAKDLKPACLVDVATLTGACMVALGPHTTGLFANQQPLAEHLLQAAAHQGEDLWRLPLTQVLKEQLKSDVADMRNTGERYGGAITAALFLQEFVDSTPWAHLDIAGPATSSHEDGGYISKGATGVMVPTLIEFLEKF